MLQNKKRVLIQREILGLLTGNKKGGLDRYTKATGVREFMPKKYVDHPIEESVIKFWVGGNVAHGFEATDVVDICDAYLKAREAGTLLPTQYDLAFQAEIFIRASAKVGIEALIDEATGYQTVRDADELQVKLQAYIAKDLNQWTKTFPEEFFDQLYRLEGLQVPSPRRAYPQRFGKYVMNFVYDTMDPDIANWLRENNPEPEGRRHHHHWLTQEYGQPKLIRHLMSVLGIMKASTTMENFRENLNRAFPEVRAKRRAMKALAASDPRQGELEFTYL